MIQDWEKNAIRVGKIFVSGGIGALLSYLAGLPPEPTIIFTIAGLRLIESWIRGE